MTKNRKIIQAVCPTRIDFTGGFTDVLPFRAAQWVDHISLAIKLPVEVTLEPRGDDLITLENKRDHTVAAVGSVDEIEDRFSLIRTALNSFGVKSNIAVTIHSHAPNGAGLGTSGALSVALVAALYLFTGKAIPNNRGELAFVAAEIERISGTMGGLQDQFAAATGGLNLFRFYRSEYSSKRINLSDQLIKELEQHVVILYPGGSRRSTDIVTGVMEEYHNGNSMVSSALLSLNELAPKILKALESAQWGKLSSLLQSVREQQVILHLDIVNDGNQKIIDDLNKEGVKGIKLLGGGGSGACLLAVSTSDASRKSIENISKMNGTDIIPVQCVEEGIQVKVENLVPAI
ncbi:MAG: hypothetical protein HY372_00035 [Candidatus Andersenbacteria bacterium]|nr:hypothetical protein [Candidatus Andersenbacteria bacterium]